MFFRLRREKAKILASTSDSVEANERLAERFGTTPEKIALLANRLEARDVSLDAKVFDDGAATVLDTVPGSASFAGGAVPRRTSVRRSVHACVREAVEKLDPRERFIVEVRMMADRADELSLAENRPAAGRVARACAPARGAREAEAPQAPRDARGRALERGLAPRAGGSAGNGTARAGSIAHGES